MKGVCLQPFIPPSNPSGKIYTQGDVMFAYLLGAYSKTREFDKEADLSTIDIVKLEEVLGEAKRIQFPDKYIMNQEMVDKEKPEKHLKISKEVADILTKILRVSNLTRHEITVLMHEVKTYEKEAWKCMIKMKNQGL